MDNILLFLCSGTSSRFNGKTKALEKLTDKTVIEFNINNLKDLYDAVYVVANENNVSEFEQYNLDANLLAIKTGNGDADSLLNALDELEKIIDFKNCSVTLCWGDTVFYRNSVFEDLIKDNGRKLQIACALDNKPYAYFDFITDSGNIDNARILKSHFKAEKSVSVGLHDKSAFRIPLDLLYKNLKYFKEKHFEYSNDELKFLKFIDYYSDILDIRCVLCDSDTSASFNTPEELEDIRRFAQCKPNLMQCIMFKSTLR